METVAGARAVQISTSIFGEMRCNCTRVKKTGYPCHLYYVAHVHSFAQPFRLSLPFFYTTTPAATAIAPRLSTRPLYTPIRSPKPVVAVAIKKAEREAIQGLGTISTLLLDAPQH
jgi:hypothetical protein